MISSHLVATRANLQNAHVFQNVAYTDWSLVLHHGVCRVLHDTDAGQILVIDLRMETTT